ncbi:hypothetical protein HZS_3518 [Henneguya salminicola]|nr:hypothetical protein HZS_3518 [Henneguya salminicola]
MSLKDIGQPENPQELFENFLGKEKSDSSGENSVSQVLKLGCCWNNCGLIFDTTNVWESYQVFENHLLEHGDAALVDHKIDDDAVMLEFKCEWINCSWNILMPKNPETVYFIAKHLSEHAHHSRLISVGKKYCQVNKLPDCKSSDKFLPEYIPIFKCNWLHCPDNQFTSPILFYSHVIRHVNWVAENEDVDNKRYQCCWLNCTQNFDKKQKLGVHLRQHSCEKRIACHTCGACFVSTTKLRHHIFRQTSTKDGIYSCYLCSKKLSCRKFFYSHLDSHMRPYQCQFCDFSCGRKENLDRHFKFKHSETRNFLCQVCKKTYKSASELNHHYKIHSDEPKAPVIKIKKIFGCHLCNGTFKRAYHVKRHLLDVHGFEKNSTRKYEYEKNENEIYYLCERFR